MEYKFTKSAENAIQYANDIAIEFKHNYIGTEHLLYGLVKENTGIANKVLENQNITEDNVLAKIESLIGIGKNDIDDTVRIYSKNKKSHRKCIYGSKKIR